MHQINISQASNKKEKYQALLSQLTALINGEDDKIANLANIAAALKESCGYFWVGFYLVKGHELVLGPFQGPVACTRIGKGKGVCGTAWETKEVMVVPDVDKFPGHIACNSASRSEVVLPIVEHNRVTMVLDVDSDKLNDFDHEDVQFLKAAAGLISRP